MRRTQTVCRSWWLYFHIFFHLWLEIINKYPSMHITHSLHLRNILSWSLFIRLLFVHHGLLNTLYHLSIFFLFKFSFGYNLQPFTMVWLTCYVYKPGHNVHVNAFCTSYDNNFSSSYSHLFTPISSLLLFVSFSFLKCMRLAPSRSNN